MEKISLAELIVKVVKESWSTNKSPLLLSKLGNEEGGEVARSARVYAGSLARFIENEVTDVRIVKHSKIASLAGAVPKQITDDADHLLAQVQSSSVKKTIDGTRNAGRKDLLRCLLESLDESDARRIDIPLDIAQKLSQVRL